MCRDHKQHTLSCTGLQQNKGIKNYDHRTPTTTDINSLIILLSMQHQCRFNEYTLSLLWQLSTLS